MTSESSFLVQNLDGIIARAQNDLLEESDRTAALEAVTKLTTMLQKPEDAIFKTAFQYTIFMAIRVGVDIGIFEALEGKDAMTSKQLAEETGADSLLIDRILRVLVASGHVGEEGPSTYKPTVLTKKLHERTMVGLIKYIYDLSIPVAVKLPEYLRKHGHVNPESRYNGPWQFAFNTNLDMFDWLLERPEELDKANTFFEANRGSRINWVDWFPVQERLLDGSKANVHSPLIVDVAGGRGRDIASFKKKFSDEPGRFVLQDQPTILNEITSLDESIERVGINFWTDSPVEGSRIYYMKFILHDWSDDECRIILNNIKKVMKNGYSKLVIEDFIIADEKAHLLPVTWDLLMMLYLGSMERTKQQWKTLLKSAGFIVEGTYLPPGDGTGIIVAEPAS